MATLAPWATASAVSNAKALGIDAGQRDFRDAFVWITEAVVGLADVARYIGATRDAERWAVPLAGVPVEVMYSPATAMITVVERPRERPEPVMTGPASPVRNRSGAAVLA